MKQIAYVGLDRCDFIYHLANILSLQGTVLVVDNSIGHDLIDSVSVDGTRQMREWRNIVYASDIDVAKSNTESYAFVLVYMGMTFGMEDLEGNDYLLVMPDYTAQSIAKIKDGIPADLLSGEGTMIILRDNCSKRLTQKSVAQYIGIHPKKIVGYIALDRDDMGAYVSLGYNHYCNVKALSQDMIEALKFVSGVILGISDDSKTQAKVMAAATKIK